METQKTISLLNDSSNELSKFDAKNSLSQMLKNQQINRKQSRTKTTTNKKQQQQQKSEFETVFVITLVHILQLQQI